MMQMTYQRRRNELEQYFDRTAADAWSKLTSDAPVSRIRQTVREGRDEMRNTLLRWLPEDLTGRRILDAGCGTGALSVEAAKRGAEVVAIDLSPTLIKLARERTPEHIAGGRIDFQVGDMHNLDYGQFDHVVAMDSLIHYAPEDITDVLGRFAEVSTDSVVFTYAPYTPLLGLMHNVGKLFPRSDRAPAIVPVSERQLTKGIEQSGELSGWLPGRTRRVSSGFYKSQAMELIPSRDDTDRPG